jgi:hypothetical protein
MAFAALASVALIAAPGAAAARRRRRVAGSSIHPRPSTARGRRGGNTIIDLNATASYTGTFSGTSAVKGTLIFHADGSANFHDVETFTGTVKGVSGTVTFNLTGRNGPGFTNFHATDTIISASGNLAGLHGVLNWESVTLGANGPLGAYSGQILFGT